MTAPDELLARVEAIERMAGSDLLMLVRPERRSEIAADLRAVIAEARALCEERAAYASQRDTLEQALASAVRREEALREALEELHAIVLGECPALLNEDSGGSARLALKIEELLAARALAPPAEKDIDNA